ncbi:MAG: transposase [Hydrogenophilales bacterium]|nr:transposase [Hydrogenophilales bacterium]
MRKGRVSESGRIYLVTAVTEQRVPVFRDFTCARLLVSELRAADTLGLSKTWAFVVMPDHIHWLLELTEGELSKTVLRVKSRSAIAINRAMGDGGQRVWQKGFHDHALRAEDDLQQTARYVIANPVRAGLVASVRDYPHWDAAWL